MNATAPLRTRLDSITVALCCLLSLLALPPILLAWIIVFDSTGLDTVVPEPVFTYLLPGLTAALVPTVGSHYFYDHETALRVGTAMAFIGTALAVVGCWTTTGGVVIC